MKVAFVVQRCGLEVNGGAESLCLQIARRMAAHWQTEVITTCALDYMSWENWYPAGLEQFGGTVVRRFPVDQPRDVPSFNRLSSELCARQTQATLEEQETWMQAQGPMSTELLKYLETYKNNYDAFFFFGYLYATTYFGLPIVQDKAFLVPLAHDEWTIQLPMWDRFVRLPRTVIFNTAEEKKFFIKRFPDHQFDGPVTGIGLEAPEAMDIAGFRKKYSLHDPFLLYVGRIDASKGCAELFDWFKQLRATEDAPRKLVLLGNEVMSVPYHPDIIHLGYVSEKEKWSAMAACDWLINPSLYESLSIALLETWLAGRPAIVNGRCDVLVSHCLKSHGGVWYLNYDEWASALTSVDAPTKTILGQQGMRYVEDNYSWPRIENEYKALLQPSMESSRPVSGGARAQV